MPHLIPPSLQRKQHIVRPKLLQHLIHLSGALLKISKRRVQLYKIRCYMKNLKLPVQNAIITDYARTAYLRIADQVLHDIFFHKANLKPLHYEGFAVAGPQSLNRKRFLRFRSCLTLGSPINIINKCQMATKRSGFVNGNGSGWIFGIVFDGSAHLSGRNS